MKGALIFRVQMKGASIVLKIEATVDWVEMNRAWTVRAPMNGQLEFQWIELLNIEFKLIEQQKLES